MRDFRLKYKRADYKKLKQFFKKIKNVKDDKTLLGILEVAFYKIENGDFFEQKNTDLFELIVNSKPLKVMQFKLDGDNKAIVIIMAVKDFECGLCIASEFFHEETSYDFSLYDATQFFK